MINNESELKAEAIRHIQKTRKVVEEFSSFPKEWLNRLICFRYNLNDHPSKQIRDYVSFESKNKLRENKKITTIIVS